MNKLEERMFTPPTMRKGSQQQACSTRNLHDVVWQPLHGIDQAQTEYGGPVPLAERMGALSISMQRQPALLSPQTVSKQRLSLETKV
jgi:hypothetical protein